jgi:transcriptional regulator with PAS, ATPase and Fis domain
VRLPAAPLDSARRSPTGKLPEDLCYRLNVLTIYLPPLHERHGDIEIFVTCFPREIAREQEREIHDSGCAHSVPHVAAQ